MATTDDTHSDVLYFPHSLAECASSVTIDGSNVFGVPSDSGIVIAVNGQAILPIYNDAQYHAREMQVCDCPSWSVGPANGYPGGGPGGQSALLDMRTRMMMTKMMTAE